MNLRLRRLQQGYAPADEATWEAFRKQKLGAIVHGDFRQERNYKFHKKYFALLEFAFDAWCEFCEPREYKGQPVQQDFERFRSDTIILAGFFRPVYAINGEVRLEAESISFGNMSPERFEHLFSATINAILHKILPKGRFTETELRALVETVSEFA